MKIVSGNEYGLNAMKGILNGVASLADKIGSATLWAGKNIGYPAANTLANGIGTGVLGASRVVGQAAISSTPLIVNGAKEIYEKYPLVEHRPRELVFNKNRGAFEHRGGDFRFTKTGYALLGGSALISSLRQLHNSSRGCSRHG